MKFARLRRRPETRSVESHHLTHKSLFGEQFEHKSDFHGSDKSFKNDMIRGPGGESELRPRCPPNLAIQSKTVPNSGSSLGGFGDSKSRQ